MLNDLKALIQIPSVSCEGESGAPFGAECKRALDVFLEIAKSYGLKTGNENGYCGWAEYGDGKEIIGILCHLDVVPAGDGWSYPPYDLTLDGGVLYGRGVADNKGSAVVALHVLKALRENKVKLNRRVRVIVGLNEESGSACMKYYRANCEIPKYNVVPDADFPLINSEKGIARLQIDIASDDFFSQNVSEIVAGVRPNVVIDNCKITVKRNSPLDIALRDKGNANSIVFAPNVAQALISGGFSLDDVSVHFFEDKTEIETRGIAGHASTPDKGKNAFYVASTLLYALETNSSVLDFIMKYIASPTARENLNVRFADQTSGELTLNTGIVNYDGKTLSVTLDLRLPICAKIETVEKNIKKVLPKSATLTRLSFSPNLYISSDSPLVKTLLKTYADFTGEPNPMPIAIGGGTYARELPNSVPFGICYPDMTTNIHNVDECYPLEKFNKLPQLYYNAVLALDKIK